MSKALRGIAGVFSSVLIGGLIGAVLGMVDGLAIGIGIAVVLEQETPATTVHWGGIFTIAGCAAGCIIGLFVFVLKRRLILRHPEEGSALPEPDGHLAGRRQLDDT